MSEVGEPRLITLGMTKRWETYGIHALEAVYPFLRPGGWQTVRNAVEGDAHMVHIHHSDGVEVLLPTIKDMSGGYGRLNIYGTTGQLATRSDDTFTAFKTQLESYVQYLRTGIRPVPFEHLVEQIGIVIAAIESGRDGGRPVAVEHIEAYDKQADPSIV